MTAQSSWLAARLPVLGQACAWACARDRAPGAPYLAQLPALIAALLALLLLSGAVLAAYYDPRHAFASVQVIAREVNQGWLVQAYHTTGASLIFAALYLHLFRLMLTRGYRAPGELVWLGSVKLLAALLALGWLGFALMGGAADGAALQAAADGALRLGGAPGAVGRWIFGGADGAHARARLLVLHAVLALLLLPLLGLFFSVRRAAAPRPPKGQGVAVFPHYAAQFAVVLAASAFVFALFAFFLPDFGMPRLDALPAEGFVLPLGEATLPWYLAAWGAVGGVAQGLWGIVVLIALIAALPWLDRGGGGRVYTALLWLLGLVVLTLTVCPAPLAAELGTVWVFVHFAVLTPLVTTLETRR